MTKQPEWPFIDQITRFHVESNAVDRFVLTPTPTLISQDETTSFLEAGVVMPRSQEKRDVE